MAASAFRNLLAAMSLLFATTASAQTNLKPELAGIGFLAGHWTVGPDKVVLFGSMARGSSDMTTEADGAVLLCHTQIDMTGVEGQSMGRTEQILMIYFEGNSLKAEYANGGTLIHYATAVVVPGRSLTLTSAAQVGIKTFQLAYELEAPDAVKVSFSVAQPGHDFETVATNTLRKGG